MSGNVPAEDGATILAAWTARGETGSELAAAVEALRERAPTLALDRPCFDVVGTGGSGLIRYNVSTTVCFVLAAAGIPVAKHGNRGSARANGSFDFLEALGIPLTLPIAAHQRLFADHGLCFLFARAMHPAVAAVAPMRRLVHGRTIFNLAGPLANPARPCRQMLGVAHSAIAPVLIQAAQHLGLERALVVNGHPGLDEISITGPTHVWDLRDGRSHHQVCTLFHQPGLDHVHLPGGDATENAATFLRLINGTETGPLLDLVAANAGAAMDCWHGRNVGTTACSEARALILNGAVQACFERFVHAARIAADSNRS